ncbi:MAG: LppP/LprE family lipoprotein [Solirubrobacteraceae bacterium]|jgi:hypothetical protein
MRLPNTALALGLAATLAACGSSTPTKVAAGTSTTASTTSRPKAQSRGSSSTSSSTASSTASSTSASSTASSTTTPSSSSSSSSSSSTVTTRTETAPAFVGTNPTSATAVGHDLAAAIAVLARHGYTPLGTATYDAGDTLRVLIGRRSGTADERAFFFDQTIYLGTDSSTPSGQITLAGQNDTEATLAYGIYRPGASSPSSTRLVHFALDMGQLSALDPLPSVTARR